MFLDNFPNLIFFQFAVYEDKNSSSSSTQQQKLLPNSSLLTASKSSNVTKLGMKITKKYIYLCKQFHLYNYIT